MEKARAKAGRYPFEHLPEFPDDPMMLAPLIFDHAYVAPERPHLHSGCSEIVDQMTLMAPKRKTHRTCRTEGDPNSGGSTTLQAINALFGRALSKSSETGDDMRSGRLPASSTMLPLSEHHSLPGHALMGEALQPSQPTIIDRDSSPSITDRNESSLITDRDGPSLVAADMPVSSPIVHARKSNAIDLDEQICLSPSTPPVIDSTMLNETGDEGDDLVESDERIMREAMSKRQLQKQAEAASVLKRPSACLLTESGSGFGIEKDVAPVRMKRRLQQEGVAVLKKPSFCIVGETEDDDVLQVPKMEPEPVLLKKPSGHSKVTLVYCIQIIDCSDY